jgi:drug/metabolite transporter (DMT)-like permease
LRGLTPAVWAAFAVMGFLNNAIPFTFIVHAQTSISSGLASILNATTPLFTILVAGVFLSDERFSVMRLAGVAIGLFGVVVMIGTDALDGIGSSVWAQMFSLGAAVSYGFASVFGRRFRRLGIDPIQVAMGQVTMSSLMLWPVAIVLDRPFDLAMPSVTVWGALGVLSVICTACAYILYFKVLERAGATNISMVTFLVPVSAILLGILFLGETLHISHVIGMLLIGLGLIVIDGRMFSRMGN